MGEVALETATYLVLGIAFRYETRWVSDAT
jgi:hypothetical protein